MPFRTLKFDLTQRKIAQISRFEDLLTMIFVKFYRLMSGIVDLADSNVDSTILYYFFYRKKLNDPTEIRTYDSWLGSNFSILILSVLAVTVIWFLVYEIVKYHF
jgi:hypothetical protein